MSSLNQANNQWLPTTRKEMDALGWTQADVILFSGDAYIDHPSFGTAVIGRVLQAQGFRVAIVPQPNWRDDLRDFRKLGAPRLFFGVSAGAMDSMVNHYTANKRLRSDDAYTPGARAGYRPDYPTIVYTKILKQLFPEVPVVVGGVEASMRRFTHYDYWQNKLLPSMLIQSSADILVYGMGERPIIDIANFFDKNDTKTLPTDIPQTAIALHKPTTEITESYIQLYSHEECLSDKVKFAKNFRTIEEQSNSINAKGMFQKCDELFVVVHAPYCKPTTDEIDAIYDLPYTRMPHPKYNSKDSIPAYEMIKFSVNIHRGCFGGCAFCTIAAHQGKQVVSRSEKSITNEITKITKMPDFKGNISDLGGPSANMYMMQGRDSALCQNCKRPSCIWPSICKNLNTNHAILTDLYKKALKIDAVKKVYIGSGIRYDLLFENDFSIKPDNYQYLKQLIENHVSGRLKVAPEHTQKDVLFLMRKPDFTLFRKFNSIFDSINKLAGLNQQLIPYFISSHPSCTQVDMAQLAAETKSLNFRLEQVQDFTPTPMTLSTVVYYSGINPYTLNKVFTACSNDDKVRQRMFFFWYKNEYKTQIVNELRKLNRLDLVDKLFGSKKSSVAPNKTERKRRR